MPILTFPIRAGRTNPGCRPCGSASLCARCRGRRRISERRAVVVLYLDGVGLGPDRTLWAARASSGARRLEPGGEFPAFPAAGGSAPRAIRGARHLRCAGSPTRRGRRRESQQPTVACRLRRRVNAPPTTAVGRLFDARRRWLAFACMQVTKAKPRRAWRRSARSRPPLPMPLARDALGVWRSDWAPLVRAMLDQRCDTAARAAMFHASLAQTCASKPLPCAMTAA